MAEMMKAVVYTRYGPPEVLHPAELEKPAPRDREVLIKIDTTTAHIGDTIMRSLNVPGPAWQRWMSRLYLGLFRPRRPVLGMELSGVVESAGRLVTRYRPGDAVVAMTLATGFGGYAEYKSLPEDGTIARKPGNLSFEEAAALPCAGVTALHCLEKAGIRPGQKVLIYGASGSVGTCAMQLARNHFGAEVTGVCSTANLALVRSLGAVEVIDYTREDFTKRAETYDVIFDAVGKLSREQAKRAAGKTRVFLNVHTASSGANQREGLERLVSLVEEGKFRPVIDRRYQLEQIVEAHRYVEAGHKKGNVVVTVAA